MRHLSTEAYSSCNSSYDNRQSLTQKNKDCKKLLITGTKTHIMLNQYSWACISPARIIFLIMITISKCNNFCFVRSNWFHMINLELLSDAH